MGFYPWTHSRSILLHYSYQRSTEQTREVQTNLVQPAQGQSLLLQSVEEKDQQDLKTALVLQQAKVSEWA